MEVRDVTDIRPQRPLLGVTYDVQPFYRRWIWANAWSEGIGLSTTLLLGMLAASRLEARPGPLGLVAGAALAVVLGTLLEGVLVGWAQGRVLHRQAAVLPVGRWTAATAAGAGAAWLLGMVPSTVMALMAAGAPNAAPPAEPSAATQYALAAAMGLVLGVVLALPQMVVLRRAVPRPVGWLGANALAWAAGMPLIFVGMDLMPWEGSRWAIAAGVIFVCFAVGAVVGAIHGLYLRARLASTANRRSR